MAFVLTNTFIFLSKPDQNCGSEPARESGVSVDINAGCDGLFASRLAPTLIRFPYWKLVVSY
ncbi:hypothetical protein D3C81_2070330 [compost metagenome]